ncbi:MAG: RagB/SusD family nutrient uptake outer membrane protein [Odoribacteraceae bacterium]|jgi:hypothetical protein|nr:RagB/SusD family nutrient uptake outer membrane protein [Odoribacteraceae bacterium]
MKYKILSTLVACLLASACSDFLEEKSQDEVIPKTTTDFRELLLGSGYPTTTDPAYFLNYMDDDIELFFTYHLGDLSFIGSTDAVAHFPRYTWQPYFDDQNGLGQAINEDPASTAYYRYYERVKGCNAVLDYIDEAIGTRQDRDRVKAEALAVRAYYYFQLVNLYGEPYSHNPDAPGVPLKLLSGIDAELSRSTVATVYNRIVADLSEAARLMDPLAIVRKDYHVNQPAIHILLSRVYLHMERWDDCIQETNKAFAQGTALTDTANLRVLGSGTSDAGNPTPASYLTYDNPEVEWYFGGSAGGDDGAYSPKPEFLATFDPVNDARYRYGIVIDNTNDRGTVMVYKRVRGSGVAVQTIRAAEAVLNRAEAYAQSGKLTEALRDLNDLRRSRIVGYANETISGKEALVEAIREERRKEFCYEGFRWFDLRRYGMPAIAHRYQADATARPEIFTLEEKDPMYTLPFPNSLVLRNPKLVQNPSRGMAERGGIPE